MDKDGNDLDAECSRPQKHAKSPELAREFLLDAATVIFKEQVEKAFRDGTARQNAHSIFVCLALQLLEERVHVACKEIITLEKQTKLLEEEEKEKREEEERKERRRAKEREKKLRRKERLRVKDKDREKKSSVSSEIPGASNGIDNDEDEEDESPICCEQPNVIDDIDAVSGLVYCPSRPVSPNTRDEHVLNDPIIPEIESLSTEGPDVEFTEVKNDGDSYSVDYSKISHRKPKFEAYSQNSNGWNKQSRINHMKSNARNHGPKFGERFHYRNDVNSCTSCNRHSDYKPKVETHNVSKQYYRVNKYNQMDYTRENGVRPKSKVINGNNNRDLPHVKKVWEPTESPRKHPRSNSDTDMSQASTCKTESGVSDKIKLADAVSSEMISGQLHETSKKENNLKAAQSSKDTVGENSEICTVTKFKHMSVSSTSDNCSSCLSEGDSNTSSSSSSNPESSSDSEDVGQHTIRKETSVCVEKVLPKYQEPKVEKVNFAKGEVTRTRTIPEHTHEKGNISNDLPRNQVHNMDDLRQDVNINSQHPGMVPTMHDPSIPFSMYQTPPLSAMGYYHQGPVSWGPPAHTNGLLPFHPPNHYVFPSPFEYGMHMDQHFMQYGAHQHSTPLLNPGEVPVYQPVVNSKDQTVNLKTCSAQESFGKVSMQKAVPVGPPASKKVPGGNNMPNGNFKKSEEANTGFSLFHFGTPLALSAGYQLNPIVPCKDGIVEDEHNRNNKKDPVEEYNLFAASNGTRFPFF